MVNRFVAIFLVLSLLAPLATTLAVLHLRKREIRREVKERMMAGLSDHDLVRIAVHRKEATKVLRWEHAHEFEYGDVMYDVVRQKSTPDSLVYWCWEDRAESQVNRQLDKAVAGIQEQDPAKKEHESRFHSFLKSLWIIQDRIRQVLFGQPCKKTTRSSPEALLTGVANRLFQPPQTHR